MQKQLYTILFSKPHNKHYLLRYIKFIVALIDQNCNDEYMELHHICPKSKDLFPEYANLKINQWNKIKLTARQHFIAHQLLWKSYGGSQRYAFIAMANGVKNKHQQNRVTKLNSKSYSKLKEEYSKSRQGENNYFYHHKFIGENNHFYNKQHTPETKALIGSYHTGKVETAETRTKKSKSHIGLKQSSETILKQKSLKWFYNPDTGLSTRSLLCPDGYLPGRNKPK